MTLWLVGLYQWKTMESGEFTVEQIRQDLWLFCSEEGIQDGFGRGCGLSGEGQS